MYLPILKSLVIFFISALCEIGGGYLIWLWLKENKPFWYGITGGFILVLYGVIAALQTTSFGRVYIAYGGIFIMMAFLFAWKFDGFKPDKYDLIGTGFALLGVCLSMYAPRN